MTGRGVALSACCERERTSTRGSSDTDNGGVTTSHGED